ncbi:MAG: pilus assembly protein CpaB [Actinomycetota bacterium]|jgi:pilus assembly protein CpaB|nr:pilus assembly protein CpaB [Actinomycetota bacterium]
MKGRAAAVLAAMLVGLIGVAFVLFYAKGADARAVEDQRPQTVFIAAELVPSGTTAADAVSKGLMVPTQIAAKGVPMGALSAVDAATGKLVAVTDIAAGDFVVASRFGTTPKGQKAIQVPVGQVAISVALSDPGRVGTFMTPGSRIVIYDTYVTTVAGPGVTAGSKVTRVLLDNLLVIAVGSTSLTPVAAVDGKAPADASGSTLVTVALPPATAAKLVHGIQTGTLYGGLSGTGTKTEQGQIISDSTLFNK